MPLERGAGWLDLKGAGHDVIVSVPCSGQIEAEAGCHNGAAPTGEPAVGPFTKAAYTNGDFQYVHSTPVMATMYGLDVLAPARWDAAPALVLSGPNEGQNTGPIVNSSGTMGNVQFSVARGSPALVVFALWQRRKVQPALQKRAALRPDLLGPRHPDRSAGQRRKPGLQDQGVGVGHARRS